MMTAAYIDGGDRSSKTRIGSRNGWRRGVSLQTVDARRRQLVSRHASSTVAGTLTDRVRASESYPMVGRIVRTGHQVFDMLAGMFRGPRIAEDGATTEVDPSRSLPTLDPFDPHRRGQVPGGSPACADATPVS